ncbi:hypothetical protein C8J57DRAFT_1221929 [Mycena rebaudengoi]|nr:hypothetical protein C8J57DRAFT_1221929 [Mycena rebaudengoi]
MLVQASPFLSLLALAVTSSAIVLRGAAAPPTSPPRLNPAVITVCWRSSPTVRYVSNVTINGQTFRALIDTGSSDLWIATSSSFAYNDTGIPVKLFFGDAKAPTNVTGSVGLAEVRIGDWTVWQQASTSAFLNATHIGVGGVTSLGLDRLIGLSFDGNIASPITKALKSAGKPSDVGQPFLYNGAPEKTRCLTLFGLPNLRKLRHQVRRSNAFERVQQKFRNLLNLEPELHVQFSSVRVRTESLNGDLEGSAEASFTINEYDDDYAAVAKAPVLPVFPPNAGRWNFLIDDIWVSGTKLSFPKSTIKGAPQGKLSVLMDTGNPGRTFPPSLWNALYSRIPGAHYVARGSFDEDTGEVRCFVTIGSGTLAPEEFDMVFGANLLRNWYTVGDDGGTFIGDVFARCHVRIRRLDDSELCNNTQQINNINEKRGERGGEPEPELEPSAEPFNFGSATEKSITPNASLQLLSQTNPKQAAQDVVKYNRLCWPRSCSVGGTTDASSGTTGSDDQAKKWEPIVVGLLGANLLVSFVLVAIGLMTCVKKGAAGRTRGAPSYVPVKFKDEDST